MRGTRSAAERRIQLAACRGADARRVRAAGWMHVALNLSHIAPGEMGGLEVYARELAAALARRDDVRLTLIGNRLTPVSWAELGELTRLPLDPRRRGHWVRGDQWDAPRAASAAGADLIHFLASTAAAAGGPRRVVTVHDLNYLMVPGAHFGIRGLGMRALVPLAVRRSHRIVAPSQSTAGDLVSRLGVATEKVDVVPEGVTPAGQVEGGPSLEGSRATALSVSAKRPHKNLLRLIGALALLPEERRPLLVLPGYSTPHERELRQRAEQLGVGGDVRFLGWVSDAELERLYAEADVFVFPSLYEGFGLPLLEAMARGVPVATSGRASLAEVAGDAALVFDPEDEGAIARAIDRLLSDPELAERLSRAGRKRAGQFTWEATAEGTVASYRRALEDSA